MSTLKFFIGSMAMAAILSCNKNDSFDIKGETEVVFFTNSANLGNLPGNSVDFTVVNIPAGSGWTNLSTTLPDNIRIPVFASKPVGQDVVINAEPDNSLIAAYNTANNTDYKELPAGILNTQSLTARIAQGATTSADSLTISVDQSNLSSLTETSYMVPVRLTGVSAAGAGRITSNEATRVVYIILNTELRKIRFLAAAADAEGTIQDRTGWVYSLTPEPVSTGNILDGLTSTYSRWGSSPGQVDLDMQTTHSVTGLRLYTSNRTTYVPTQIDVYTSEDGINYSWAGSPQSGDLAYESSYNYILFYTPVQARYVRLQLNYSTSTSTQNRRLAELDVYAN